jgi:hypothetical protein
MRAVRIVTESIYNCPNISVFPFNTSVDRTSLNKITPWSRILFEKLITAELVKIPRLFSQPKAHSVHTVPVKSTTSQLILHPF